ncbi:hypothetical protein H0H81_001717 [Sphagnurus paluster]|uniref:HAT C-terminal dimerisation domain-containing protein n=1 Tax=Sphagnurus paluster TaxID=117069 RepID=A0A9P7FQR8_9AGAR|nr:hypothetical protein H0H81_001717 [Sphagnurus paluster]
MVLHPRHKLAYFKAACWEKRWIDTAQKLVCDEFEHSYVSWSQSEGSDKSDSNVVIPEPPKAKPCASKNMFEDLFDTLSTSSVPVVDELQLYLSTEVENIIDPIKWWYKKCKTYPRLYQMALDYLTIPSNNSFSYLH